MIQLNWDDHFNHLPRFDGVQMKLGTLSIPLDEVIEFAAPVGSTRVRDLMLLYYFLPGLSSSRAQLAMLVFAATRRPYALNPYFPLTKTLDKIGQQNFYRLAGEIILQPNFKVGLVVWKRKTIEGTLNIDKSWDSVEVKPTVGVHYLSPLVAEIVFFVACHIAEIFYYRRDILDRLLKTGFEIRLSTSAGAFKQDGGVAGGNYDPERGRIQMMLSRLFEGYNDKSPGVAPFLHEFGHLLDHFDTTEGELGKSKGTLPGMRPEDGTLYDAEAHELFLKGKTLEWERYMKLSADGYREGDPFPIGHPYVFQNDTEFIAGYLEMFFRNPHYFAAQNPDLYESFRLTFRQDPRQFWEEDFPFYIQQNQTYYRGLQRPPDDLGRRG
jgi:hypothetical protein